MAKCAKGDTHTQTDIDNGLTGRINKTLSGGQKRKKNSLVENTSPQISILIKKRFYIMNIRLIKFSPKLIVMMLAKTTDRGRTMDGWNNVHLNGLINGMLSV